MIELLKANFNRLKKNNVFWIIFAIIIAFVFILFISQYNDKNTIHLEEDLFIILFFIGIAISIFTSLFIGTDYSDGTIRNKIIRGKKRNTIYLSNLISSVIVSIIYFLLYILIVLIFGRLLFDSLKMPFDIILYLFVDSIFLIIALSSIFTFISMLVSNKVSSAVVSILIIFWLIVLTIVIQQKLLFVTGIKKIFYQFIYDFLPTGQGLQIASLNALNYKIFPLYSFILILIINILGIVVFNKKELK